MCVCRSGAPANGWGEAREPVRSSRQSSGEAAGSHRWNSEITLMRMMPDEDDGHNEDVGNYNVKTPTCARGCRGRQAYCCADYCSLAACLSVCLSVFRSFFMSDCLFCHSVFPLVAFLSVSLSACFSACLSVRRSFYPHFSESVFLPASLSVCLFLSVSLSVTPSCPALMNLTRVARSPPLLSQVSTVM